MLPSDSIIDFVEREKNSIISLLEKLVLIDSGSQNIAGIMQVAEIIAAELGELGFENSLYEFKQAGPNLVSKRQGESEPFIILLGHMDTVFDSNAQKKNPFRKENGKIYGPGALDMKGGIVQIVYALKVLKHFKKHKYGIKVILVGDEESGHPNSNALELFNNEAREALCVFCCEFGRTNNQIVLERKGVGTLTLEVWGRSAHSGNELAAGRNAVAELSRQIVKIDSLYTDPQAEITASIDIIEGGTAVNVVPDRAKGIFDIRFSQDKSLEDFVEHVKIIAAKPHKDNLKTEVSYHKEYPPMVKSDKSIKLLHFVSHLSEKNGFGVLKGISVGGGADSTFFSALGIPTICSFGPVGENAHTYDEFIYEKDFFERIVLLADCLINIDQAVFD